MASLKLKPGRRARVLHGHCWVYAGEIQKLLPAEHDGQALELRDAKGYFLGTGIYNSQSQIVWRRISRDRLTMDEDWLRERLMAAVKRRWDRPCRRLVWSEADGLPGLIVDQFAKQVVVQTLTLAMDQRLSEVATILSDLPDVQTVVARNESPVRRLEGLPIESKVLFGEPEAAWVQIGQARFRVDPRVGNKTGFYLDQQGQYERVSPLAKGRRVLDTFSNQGGFAIHCALSGAGKVRAVEISGEAVEIAKENALENGVEVDWVEANVFDDFHRDDLPEWDMIILDPPSFARSRAKVAGALRGFKELHLRAIQQLAPGGILVTYCCSHHVSPEMFSSVIAEASADARRDLRVVDRCGQPPDHPVLIGVPETSYLHGLILEVM